MIDLADVLGGDFNGPEGGVAENDFVVFANDTGKLGKKAPPNSIPNSLLAQVPSGTLKGRASAGNGSPEDLTPVQALAILKGAGAYAKDNILINNICPGFTATERLKEAGNLPEIESRMPLGRVATPEEFANLAVFLASERASYISGESIAVSAATRWS